MIYSHHRFAPLVAVVLLAIAMPLPAHQGSTSLARPRAECPEPLASAEAAAATPWGTPNPTPEPAAAALPDPALAILNEEQASEDDLPVGIPADPTTVEAITELEEAFVACYNAGELLRLTELMTEQNRAATIASYEQYPDTAIRLATPSPYPREERIRRAEVRDVRLLPDGRAGAIVEWNGEETNFRIYEYVDGRWLIDDELFVYDFG